jgi:hypothetical protein
MSQPRPTTHKEKPMATLSERLKVKLSFIDETIEPLSYHLAKENYDQALALETALAEAQAKIDAVIQYAEDMSDAADNTDNPIPNWAHKVWHLASDIEAAREYLKEA